MKLLFRFVLWSVRHQRAPTEPLSYSGDPDCWKCAAILTSELSGQLANIGIILVAYRCDKKNLIHRIYLSNPRKCHNPPCVVSFRNDHATPGLRTNMSARHPQTGPNKREAIPSAYCFRLICSFLPTANPLTTQKAAIVPNTMALHTPTKMIAPLLGSRSCCGLILALWFCLSSSRNPSPTRHSPHSRGLKCFYNTNKKTTYTVRWPPSATICFSSLPNTCAC